MRKGLTSAFESNHCARFKSKADHVLTSNYTAQNEKSGQLFKTPNDITLINETCLST